MVKKSVLLCEPDSTWEQKIISNLSSDEYEISIVKDGKAAQQLLFTKEFDSILMSLDLKNFSSIEVIKYIKFNNKKVRIIITCDSEVSFKAVFKDAKSINKLGIADHLVKPFTIEKLHKILSEFNLSESWKDLEGKQSSNIEEEVSELDDNFTGIKIKDFFCGNISIFDLYIRLKRNKYLKVLHSGDFMEAKRLINYKKEKNVTHLYFKTKDRHKYINYMNDLLSKVIPIQNVKTDKKVNLLMNTTSKYVEEIYLKGINKNLLKEGMDICEHVYQIVDNDPNLRSLLKKYMDLEDSNQNHIFLTTFFSTIIAKNIDWVTERSMKTILLGAMFHDIGKLKLPAAMRNKKQFELSAEQLVEYQKHCLYGVELLDKNPLINEQILQIIYQHHELINGEGFPNQLSGTRIYPLAKIISFADFLANYTIRVQKSPFYTIKTIIEEKKDIYNYDPESVKSMIKGLIK